MKKVVSLNETQLKKIVAESVKRVLKKVIKEDSEDELEDKVALALAEFPYFWYVDFDKNAYRDLIPNFDELMEEGDRVALAKAIIDASDWTIEEWMDYIPRMEEYL